MLKIIKLKVSEHLPSRLDDLPMLTNTLFFFLGTPLSLLSPLLSPLLFSLVLHTTTGLTGLQSLTNLMELYLCSNRIMNVKEVQHLKNLPKLIIVDLSGNRLCRHESYRLYCVYYLRKLKVLDGIGVDINEQQKAREKYSGKLTAEFLAEKIGHKYFEHIRELGRGVFFCVVSCPCFVLFCVDFQVILISFQCTRM